MIVVVDGVQEFDLLSQRIHPAASRVEKLAERDAGGLRGLRRAGDRRRGADGAALRRAPRAAGRGSVADPVELTPVAADRDGAGQWLTGVVGGRDRQAGRSGLPARRAQGDGEDQAGAHRRLRGGRVPLRQGGGHGRLPDPRDVRRGRRAARGGPHVGVQAPSRSASCSSCSSPTAPASAARASRAAGSPTRSSSGRACGRSWSCEIAFDHITGNRIRHGAKFLRWRDDKAPRECLIDQLRA